jgi:hypothetical protein
MPADARKVAGIENPKIEVGNPKNSVDKKAVAADRPLRRSYYAAPFPTIDDGCSFYRKRSIRSLAGTQGHEIRCRSDCG